MSIRKKLIEGDVAGAIDQVNDMNPDILDSNPKLYFKLQQQQLIELIKEGKIDEALLFASEELAPLVGENVEFLEEVEKTMSLLAFDNSEGSPGAHLLGNGQRNKTASELNAAILESQAQDTTPKLPTLLKMLLFAQKRLEEKISYPKILDLLSCDFVQANQQQQQQHEEDTMTDEEDFEED